MARCISVNGALFHVTDDFDEADADAMDALAWLADAARAKLDALTPDVVARQEAALARIGERNARLGISRKPGSTS